MTDRIVIQKTIHKSAEDQLSYQKIVINASGDNADEVADTINTIEKKLLQGGE